ncbi:MAG TPA: sugar ABC transporter ATP-binding protein [Actinobacteria bacterium]|nr:ribose import ATP-binding protein RbsA [bacterium BMS3Bbin01]HDH26123.1 sugar ABC transporter ATP-binding protein [Actinomycetota bacterium]
MSSSVPLLEAENVTKRFPGILALDHLSFKVRAGEIHALVGENGAGKSTLIKVLTGLYSPDEGTIEIDGKPTVFHSTRDAMACGIALVPQERMLIPAMSVAENILLGRQPRRSGFVSAAAMRDEALRWLHMLALEIDPARKASSLSVGEAQLVEVARALSLESRILILDEPTASLPPSDVTELFGILRGLRDQGVGIVFVSHKEPELYELCDRVTVLRDGKVTLGDRSLDDVLPESLIEAMVGRKIHLTTAPDRTVSSPVPALRLCDIWTDQGHQGIDLELYPGEILGLYGLVGSGRTELARAIIGLAKITAGTLQIDGRVMEPANPREALHTYGIGYISEDRRREGLILTHPVYANTTIAVWHVLAQVLGFLTQRRAREAAQPIVERLNIRTPSLNQTVQFLSGGNQQKVSIGKWLKSGTRILIFDEPTVGIDIPTKQQIHELMWNLTKSDRSILLISSDLPELIQVSDRVMVMSEHRIVGEFDNTHDYEEMSRRMMQAIQATSHLHVVGHSDE